MPPGSSSTPGSSLPASSGPPADHVVTVRAAQDYPVVLRQGFLHGLEGPMPAQTLPLVQALRPSSWRISAGFQQTAAFVLTHGPAMGTQVTVNLTDGFTPIAGYPLAINPACATPRAGCVTSVADLKAAWASYLDGVLATAQAQQQPITHRDLFSEPDVYWTALTLPDLLDMTRIAHERIRLVFPDASIVAPSISHYDGPGLAAFMQYAADNNLHLNAISWHEFGTPAEMVAHVTELRAAVPGIYSAHPALAPAELHVNEYDPPQSTLVPGVSALWLAALELAGVQVANRACWPFGGQSDCTLGLNGLLTFDNQNPLPNYFVYRAYAALDGRRVSVESTGGNVTAMASVQEAARQVRVLVGRGGCGLNHNWCNAVSADVGRLEVSGPGTTVDLAVEAFPFATTEVTAQVSTIPSVNMDQAMAEPVPSSMTVPVVGGRALIHLGSVPEGAAYEVVLQAP